MVLLMLVFLQQGEFHQLEIGSEILQLRADAFVHPSATLLAIHSLGRETEPHSLPSSNPLPISSAWLQSVPNRILTCNALPGHGSYLLDLHFVR
mmetsp:Transcript_5291/g.33240  ORF Transcript_5291/g.33240 Transcript_5291/m.33240 type:complete len:94 (+) Transcript_5291:1644-1925(+)